MDSLRQNDYSNRKYLLEFIKRKLKAHQKSMVHESLLKFDQYKTVSENYKPIRNWLWLVYKITKNTCCLWFFIKFIQTQKRYPISLYN